MSSNISYGMNPPMSYDTGNSQPKYLHQSLENSEKASLQAQNVEESPVINSRNLLINDGHPISEENKSQQIQQSHHTQEEKQKYFPDIENEKKNFGLKSEKDKAEYINKCKNLMDRLDDLYDWFKSFVINKEELIKNIEEIPKELLSNWGPKRCYIHLKLASLYNLAENWQKMNQLLQMARRDLNQMNDAEDNPEISECRRWLQLQRIENLMSDKNPKVDLNKIGTLFEKCWNVRQRHFEGRKDFLDFYTLFFAKYLLKKGDVTKARGVYKDALILRRQREAFRNQDAFDWKKLKEEVEKEIGENIK